MHHGLAALIVTACALAAQPAAAADDPLVIADATGVVLNACGSPDAPGEHVRIEALDARIRALQASTTCAPAASPSPWPQGRTVDLTAYGTSTVADAPRIEHNRVEARRILVARGLTVADLPM